MIRRGVLEKKRISTHTLSSDHEEDVAKAGVDIEEVT